MESFTPGDLTGRTFLAGLRQYHEDAEELNPGRLHGLVRAALPQCCTGLHRAAQRPGAPEDTGETPAACLWGFGCTVWLCGTCAEVGWAPTPRSGYSRDSGYDWV